MSYVIPHFVSDILLDRYYVLLDGIYYKRIDLTMEFYSK